MAPSSKPPTDSAITLRQLQYLSALAKERSLSAAARRCHVSQPALAEQIEKLESQLGKLVVRGRRSTTLTPLGAQVLDKATVVLDTIGEIERIARYPDALRIGMIDTVAPYLMSQLMATRPERIIPVQAQTKQLLAELDHARIDAAVLAAGTIPPGLHTIELGDDELFLAVNATDSAFPRTKKSARVPLTAAADHEMLLLSDGHCLRDQVTDVCRAARTTLGPLEAATIEMLVEMVARDLGVTLIPNIAAPSVARHPSVRILQLEEAPKRRLVLVSSVPPNNSLRAIASTLSKLLA